MTSEFTVAVHGLVFLNHKGGYVNSEQLADNICTNSARVRKVMAKLRKAGLIETREGLEGGYHFYKDPKEVSLAQVSEALKISFVSVAWRSGDQEKKCLIASGMAGILDELYQDLNEVCRKRLESVSIADLDRKIFKEV